MNRIKSGMNLENEEEEIIDGPFMESFISFYSPLI
jgi:hypothetical protein